MNSNQALRSDLRLIADWIAPQSQVLDLGCGDGELLAHLAQHKNVNGYGVELDIEHIIACTQVGVCAIQSDLETGLGEFDNDSFDYVILSQTIQSMHHIEHLLKEMLRVGKEAIVSFPNFAYWQNRMQIMYGQMPVTETIPYDWHNTPNIHWCTLLDFERLCRQLNLPIRERVVMDHGMRIDFFPNILGSLAFYRLGRA